MLIDIHVHTRPDGVPPRANGSAFATPEELVAMFDERGIDKAVILPEGSPESASPGVSVSQCLEVVARYPDRFIPFCNVDPRMLANSPKADFAPMLEHYKRQGCKGDGQTAEQQEQPVPQPQRALIRFVPFLNETNGRKHEFFGLLAHYQVQHDRNPDQQRSQQ